MGDKEKAHTHTQSQEGAVRNGCAQGPTELQAAAWVARPKVTIQGLARAVRRTGMWRTAGNCPCLHGPGQGCKNGFGSVPFEALTGACFLTGSFIIDLNCVRKWLVKGPVVGRLTEGRCGSSTGRRKAVFRGQETGLGVQLSGRALVYYVGLTVPGFDP